MLKDIHAVNEIREKMDDPKFDTNETIKNLSENRDVSLNGKDSVPEHFGQMNQRRQQLFVSELVRKTTDENPERKAIIDNFKKACGGTKNFGLWPRLHNEFKNEIQHSRLPDIFNPLSSHYKTISEDKFQQLINIMKDVFQRNNISIPGNEEPAADEHEEELFGEPGEIHVEDDGRLDESKRYWNQVRPEKQQFTKEWAPTNIPKTVLQLYDSTKTHGNGANLNFRKQGERRSLNFRKIGIYNSNENDQ